MSIGTPEYLLGVPTASSLYSNWDCHGRNISELKNEVVN